jgi:azurin
MPTKIISRRRWLQSAASLAGLLLLPGLISACGGSEDKPAAGAVTKLTVGCKEDELAFDQTALSAPAAGAIELTFHNHSQYHQHNWVLVNGGDDKAMAVYNAALAAGDKNHWLPPDSPDVLVHTPLLDSGNSTTISFQAPTQAGQYSYLCTFPGHYLAGMKGTLTIT